MDIRLSPPRIRLLALLSALILALLLPWIPAVGALDLKLLDEGFRLRRQWRPSPAPEVILVGIDEATGDSFPEPFTLWHRHLGDAFRGLALAQPRGVGLDLNLPDRSYETLAPGSDAELTRGILMLRRSCPVVLGQALEGNLRPKPILPPFEAAAGPGGTGFIHWPLDRDGVIRRFEDRFGMQGSAVPTLAGTLAQRLGRKTAPGLLDFAQGEAFGYIPFQQLVAWARAGDVAALRKAFQGKVVFLGSVLPWVDRLRMPVNLAGWESHGGAAPGVLLHAQAMRGFLGNGLIQPLPAWALALMGLALFLIAWMAGTRPWLGLATLLGCGVILGMASYLLLGRQLFLPPLAPASAAGLGLGGRLGAEAFLKLRERTRLRRSFSGYVSPGILQQILSGRLQPALQGERRALAVLFADIRDFTTLSEKLPPEEVIQLLNRYFSRMTEAIHRHGGTVDKFIGDGIMAFFGAPEPLEEPRRSALRAALNMQTRLEELNAELRAEERPPLRIGIGLHFGIAAVGHVGSAARNEYTAIGDTVNTASRVEGLSKDSGYPLVVTADFLEGLEEASGFDALGEKAIKGRSPVQVFGWPSKRNEAHLEEASPWKA